MNKQKDKYWRTADLYLGAYLFARGAAIAGIEARDRGVVFFTFLESWDRQNWLDEFCLGWPLIDARVYVSALRTLQDKSDAVMERYGKD